MISILIPTYNYDCYDLVKELHRQASELNIEFEIIVADDCSNTEIPRLQLINLLSNSKLIRPQYNLGRAKIRNFLADKSQYNHLLFIDSDSFPANNDFLKKYIELIPKNITILGGRIYNKAQDKHHTLLTKYGVIKERNNNPIHISSAPFTSPNFLIPKDIFNKIRFNENIKGYGHEDTIFGIELSRHNIPYNRFDNAIIHLQIEDNKTFIQKTNESVANLYHIYTTRQYPKLETLSPVLKLYLKLKRLHCVSFLAKIYCKYANTLIKYCDNQNPNLTIFSLYKLCYLCHISTKI
jgi:glycosyltransferase involved in cell wall biosynthesis